MQRWGFTSVGKARVRCPLCGVSGMRRRRDPAHRAGRVLFLYWLSSGRSRADSAAQHHLGISTLQRRFRPFWKERPASAWDRQPVRGLVLEGTRVSKRERGVLGVHESVRRRPVSGAFVPRESYPSWYALLVTLKQAGGGAATLRGL